MKHVFHSLTIPGARLAEDSELICDAKNPLKSAPGYARCCSLSRERLGRWVPASSALAVLLVQRRKIRLSGYSVEGIRALGLDHGIEVQRLRDKTCKPKLWNLQYGGALLKYRCFRHGLADAKEFLTSEQLCESSSAAGSEQKIQIIRCDFWTQLHMRVIDLARNALRPQGSSQDHESERMMSIAGREICR